MKKRCYIVFVFLLFALSNCKQSANRNDQKEGVSLVQVQPIETENVENSLEDQIEELQDFGIIENIEDGGYPFFVVSVNFVERKTKLDFHLNIETISLGGEGLNDLIGTYATIHYTSKLENNLYDIQIEGTSLFGDYAPDYNSNWHQIKGVLNGADTITLGDLPSVISITDREGKKMDFELFIDSETVKANGKTVDAFYDIRVVNTITQIIPGEEE